MKLVSLLNHQSYKYTVIASQVRTMVVEFVMGSHLDEPVKTYAACRKEVSAYLEANANWELPISVSGCSGMAEFAGPAAATNNLLCQAG